MSNNQGIMGIALLAIGAGALYLLLGKNQSSISSDGTRNTGSSGTTGFNVGTPGYVVDQQWLAKIGSTGNPLAPLISGQYAQSYNFVEAGKNTPTDFFPFGNQISTSRQLTSVETTQVVNNLISGQASQGITNAWWQPQTITQTTVPGGINSGGSYQSNIPVGVKHCPGPGLGAPATDTWHYC